MLKRIQIYLILFSSIIFSQDAGKVGLSFLKIGPSATSIAAGDIGLLDSSPASVYYNPASVNFQTNASIMFTHQIWIQDLTSEVIGANFSFLGLPFTIGVNTTKIEGFEIRTLPTETPEGKFNVNYFYGNLSTGFNIVQNLDFGFTIKYLYESLLSDDASGTAYDFGLLYRNILEDLVVGASVRNIGSMQKLRNEKTELPTDLIINAVYQYQLPSINLDIKPVIGFQKYLELEDSYFHFGAESVYQNQFSIRLGYVTGYEAKGFSAGAGVFWNGFNIDYAFTPFSYGIGNANTISLMYTFN